MSTHGTVYPQLWDKTIAVGPASTTYLYSLCWSLLITNLDYNVGGIFIIINYDVVDRPRSYLNNDIGD